MRPFGGRTALHTATAATILAGGLAVAAAPAEAAPCTDIEVVAARGTSEPGRLGLIVGDPVFAAIQRALGGTEVSSHAVDYPASLSPQSPVQGNIALVDHVNSQAASCAQQRFVLVGYSQGANVVANSLGVSSAGAVVGGRIAKSLDAQTQQRVAAVLLFGSPLRARGVGITGPLQARTKEFCANGDPVCGAGASIAAHLTYGRNANEAAQFVATQVGNQQPGNQQPGNQQPGNEQPSREGFFERVFGGLFG